MNEIKLTHKDTLSVHSDYDGDFNKYIKFKKDLKKSIIRGTKWERTAFILGLKVEQAKKYSSEIGIDSPYYFKAYLMDDKYKHPIKNIIIVNIRKKYSHIHKGINIHSLSNKDLINNFFSIRAKKLIKRQEEIMHSCFYNPTANILNDIFNIDFESFSKRYKTDAIEMVNIINNPQLDRIKLSQFVLMSKKNHIIMYPEKTQKKTNQKQTKIN